MSIRLAPPAPARRRSSLFSPSARVTSSSGIAGAPDSRIPLTGVESVDGCVFGVLFNLAYDLTLGFVKCRFKSRRFLPLARRPAPHLLLARPLSDRLEARFRVRIVTILVAGGW